ncbi:MAG: hypothetical protein D6722_23450 [Bacteroidetes bacterium]|nr:MAG: hypothetical protein D6722_23450 [Bacteroidota bacterium]
MACQPAAEQQAEAETPATDSLRYEQETHLANIRQLTFGGDNAEAYFSFDGEYLVLQRTHPAEGIPCDQIYVGKIPQSPEESFDMQLVSTGTGRTTCSYFYPSGDTIIFASTHLASEDCPPVPDRNEVKRYVWPIFESFDIFLSDREGNVLAQLTDNPGYDAEATLSPKGDKIVFTSTRNGDLDLYTMNLDGSDVQQVTDQLGYDGGAFFSPDGEYLVFRASRPQTEAEIEDYTSLLAQGLVAPSNMELYVCKVDGSELRKITDLGNANWAPFFHPSGEKIIFSSNHASGGRTFNLFMINVDGTGLEQITHDREFDAFPMFSPDGSKLVFASNRNNGGTRETNVFIADWVE